MDDEMKFAGIGAYLYGALYLVGVFTMALYTGSHAAALCAVLAAGVSYLSQVATAFRIVGVISYRISMLAWIVAALVGVLAGLFLAIGA